MVKNIFSLEGKTAIIIGGASGIGEAVVHGAADAGARVVCLDLNGESAARVAADVTARGGLCTSGALNFCDSAAVAVAFDDVAATHGLDIVICTPGVNVRKPILKYSDEEAQKVIDVNLKGNFNVLRSAGRIMTEQKRGSIVLFASIRAVSVEPGQGMYAATKAGVVQLVKTAAAEFGPSGVRVNAIGPGVIETPLTAPIKANEGWYNAYAAKSVFNRWGQPSELVGPTLFLASDAASFVTGTTIYADGGWTAVDGRFTPPGM